MKSALFVIATVLILGACSTRPSIESPYVGEEARDIKALPQSEVEGLLGGKGLGFAKAAELNGYPGPMHVLELRSELQLTPEQVTQTQNVFARMESTAQAQGRELVQAEREVEELFRSKQANPESLQQAVARAGELRAAVRNAHLLAHVEQTQLLTPDQIEQYIALRGYAHGDGHNGHQ